MQKSVIPVQITKISEFWLVDKQTKNRKPIRLQQLLWQLGRNIFENIENNMADVFFAVNFGINHIQTS